MPGSCFLLGATGAPGRWLLADLRWTVLRPDGLVDAEAVTPYRLEPGAERSPIFAAGQVSRINVADVMARLLAEPETWARWEGHMPVVYAA